MVGLGGLSVCAQGPIASVAGLDQLVQGQRSERVEAVQDDRAKGLGGLLGLGVGAPPGSGTTMSTTPSACWSAAVMRMAAAAVAASSDVRHRIDAQPSGLMTE